MTRTIAGIPVSPDGFVTGPDPGPDNGPGNGADEVGRPASVVVTSSPPEPVRTTDTDRDAPVLRRPGVVR